jgi:3'-5' exoribonuclease
MDLSTLAEVRRAAAQGGVVRARVHVQVESVHQKQTRDNKPYWELAITDGNGAVTLRVWSDSPNFADCASLSNGQFIEVEGEFATHERYGVEARQWKCRPLNDDERLALLGGPPDVRERQQNDFAFIVQAVETLSDPRLRAVALLFLEKHGERFQRSAAARNYHHARRGGLVEHTAQMMRMADLVAQNYPRLNRDLLLSGVLFHDVGKLWENSLPADGFSMNYDMLGELLGHIIIGIEIVNNLWRQIMSAPAAAEWTGLLPKSEEVRIHLLHLIAAHHGSKTLGSPVDPKTPEAHALHHIDNLDAKLEMVFAGYETSAQLADKIFERVRPLPGNLVEQLARYLGAEVLETEEGPSLRE